MWRPSALKIERSRQMPQGTERNGRSLAHVLFLSAALSLLSALVRRERRQLVLMARDRRKKVRVGPRRIAASLAFATLFFGGAALSAGAGNGVVQLIDPTSESALSSDTTDTTTTTTTADPSADTEQPAAGLGDAQPSPEPASSELTGVSAGQTGQPE